MGHVEEKGSWECRIHLILFIVHETDSIAAVCEHDATVRSLAERQNCYP